MWRFLAYQTGFLSYAASYIYEAALLLTSLLYKQSLSHYARFLVFVY